MSKKTWLIIILLLFVITCAAQEPKKMVLIPDYVEELTIDEVYDNHNIRSDMPLYRKETDIFVIGNFNRVDITIPTIISMPEPTVDNNIPKYIKSLDFEPNKTLNEILK